MCIGDRARIVPRILIELIEARHRVVERRRPEQDRDRIRLAVLVERAQTAAELALRDAQVACDDRELAANLRLLCTQPIRARVKLRELDMRLRQSRIECVQAEERGVGLGRERLLTAPQLACVLRSRQRRTERHRRGEREPER